MSLSFPFSVVLLSFPFLFSFPSLLLSAFVLLIPQSLTSEKILDGVNYSTALFSLSVSRKSASLNDCSCRATRSDTRSKDLITLVKIRGFLVFYVYADLRSHGALVCKLVVEVNGT